MPSAPLPQTQFPDPKDGVGEKEKEAVSRPKRKVREEDGIRTPKAQGPGPKVVEVKEVRIYVQRLRGSHSDVEVNTYHTSDTEGLKRRKLDQRDLRSRSKSIMGKKDVAQLPQRVMKGLGDPGN